MDFELPNAIEILRRTPATLDSLLRDLPEPWLVQNEGPETWSPYDVIGHLIHGEETDWIPRAKIILEHGEIRGDDSGYGHASRRQCLCRPLAQLCTRLIAVTRRLRAATYRALRQNALRQLIASCPDHQVC